MNKLILLLIVIGLGSSGYAQQDETSQPAMRNPEAPVETLRGPLLTAEQLEREKWFYSIEEAMRAPEAVYKLSLRDQDWKFFPMELTRFPNLQILNLSANKISLIPAEIHQMENLQVLILANNKIKSLPASMSELENLTQLYLAGNKLVFVPAWVGGLGKLRRLDLTYNRLTQYEIEQLENRLPRCEITH